MWMFVFASFRIGIFTTILGASLKKAWGVAFIQPVAMYLVLIPPTMWIDSLTNPMALLFGAAFLGLATGWSYFTDRAGRPAVDSTHELIQAYVCYPRCLKILCGLEDSSGQSFARGSRLRKRDRW